MLQDDRSELSQVLRELETERVRLRTIVNNMAHALVVADLNGNILEVNPAAVRMYGFANALGAPRTLAQWQDSFELIDLDGTRFSPERWPLARIIRGEDVSGLEVLVRNIPAGAQWIASYGGTLIRDTQGSPFLAMLTVQDITQRKSAEEALHKANERLRSILASITDAYFAIDRQWRFLEINPIAERMVFARSAGELLGRVLWEEYPQAVHTDFYRQYQVAMTQGQPVHFEARSGITGKWFEAHAYPRQSRLEVYLRDITDRKQAEEQLRRINETLEGRVTQRTAEAEQRSSQLRVLAAELTQAEQRERQRLAQVLHDHLQQLLVGAKFQLSVSRQEATEPQMRESLQQVDDLLDQSLDASRSLTVELSPPILYRGKFSQVLDWLADWMRAKHGLIVEVEADEQVDPRSEAIRVLLFQSVRELLFNVVKHARTNKAHVTMVRTEADQIQIVIRDDGVGFTPAGRQPVATRAGSGFGLFSIQERLESFGGRLSIDSAPGKGTQMRLIVRADLAGRKTPVAEHVGNPAGKAPNAQISLCDGDRLRVLLADDHALMRNGLARLLQMQQGIDVVGQASDGQEAIELARQMQPDVILMDVNMPGIDGVEATRRLVVEFPRIRVIGLSMYSEADMGVAMREAGAVAYLPKSTEPMALLEVIHSYCRRRIAR